MIEAEAMAGVISVNLANLRKGRQLTLDQLAKASGVSKGMVVQIERGRTNASIATLVKLANALGVTVSRLIEAGTPPRAKKVRREDAAVLWEGKAGGVGKLVVGIESPALLEYWEWTLNAGEAHEGIAHPSGARELVVVQQGALSISAGAWAERVEAGEVLAFAADAPHRYANEGPQPALFSMIVLEPIVTAGQGRPTWTRG